MSQPDDDKTRTHVTLTSGTMVSHYRIIEKIGAGGMGEVYLAEDTTLDRKVALKFLPLHLCPDADCRARFTREAQAAAKLDHPNIVAVHEVGVFQGRPFFAMQHVEGQTLKEVLTGKALPLDRILEIGIQVCDGLQAAHEKGITHRDIKPSNILIDSHGRARIVDFGLASVMGSDHLTKTGSTLGTVGYMSPEQVRGEKADHHTDLFSLGVVLYELITGHAPFKADSEAATLHAITNTKPELLARFRREIPSKLQTIIDKALDKDVATRYQHADELAADLKRLSSREAFGVGAAAPKGRWLKFAAIGAVLIVIAAVGYQVIWKNSIKERTGPDAGRKMVAVLPFQNLSPDPDQDYFSDGLTEELITNLSKVKSLCVISRSSAMTFKGSNQKAPEIGKQLNVQYLVEGSVRKAGKELRITAQLIDARNDSHLWANTYTGTLDDVFNMQDSVTSAIIEGIKIQLTPDETHQLEKQSFNNTAAFEYYLKGKAEIDKGTEDAINQGMQYFKHGIDIVGDNALIYSGMAYGYFYLVNSGFAQEDGIGKAQEYAQKALALDPELPEAYAMLGRINNAFLGNQQKAVKHFKRALLIDPDNKSALAGLASVYYGYVGRVSAAVPLIDRYLVVCPGDSATKCIRQGDLHFFAGEYDQALEQYRRAHQMGQRDPLNEVFYAYLLAYCDSTSAAIAVINRALESDSTSAVVELGRVLGFALRGDSAGALRAVTSAVRRTCGRDAGWSYFLGTILSRAGAKAEALDWLENAVNKGFINYPLMERDPFINSIRNEGRFKKLMERVKYEWEHFEI